ncbi:MAG: SMP-30/gluconolactonase/LRE family protein [Betaproteobacteria bacterium]|nr:SMP-30/gluconolactonase/LRE family protein [Betaproteobacteria bacterium]
MKRLDIVLSGLTFPEAPRWRGDKLWFSDFYSHRVMTVDLNGRDDTIAEVPGRPSGLGWTPDGDLLVISMVEKRVLRLRAGRLEPYADLSALATGPCNDMVVDQRGRAWVGNFGYDRHAGESPRTTCIAFISESGVVSRAADDVVFPNGMVITPDGKSLIVGETFANRLTRFDIAADGQLVNRRVFAELDGVAPDGICLDAEGAIWASNPTGSRMVRVFEGGRVAEVLETGSRKSYACMLGGPNRQTLFVLTNTGSGPGMADKRDGCIEAIEVDVPGVGLP